MKLGRRARQPEPIGPPLDGDGHFPAGSGDYRMWHIAAWLPDGREADVTALLADQGVEVYRMWPVRPRPPAETERDG